MGNTDPGAFYALYFLQDNETAHIVLLPDSQVVWRLRGLLSYRPSITCLSVMIFQHSAPVPRDPIFAPLVVHDKRFEPPTIDELTKGLPA